MHSTVALMHSTVALSNNSAKSKGRKWLWVSVPCLMIPLLAGCGSPEPKTASPVPTVAQTSLAVTGEEVPPSKVAEPPAVEEETPVDWTGGLGLEPDPVTPTPAAGTELVDEPILDEDGNEIQFLNTASALFPTAHLSQQLIKQQQELFLSRTEDITPVNLTVINMSQVFAGPGELYESKDLLFPGDTVRIDGKVGHWYRIANGSGFISGVNLNSDEYAPVATDTPPRFVADVVNSGGTSEVDECEAGLTSFTSIMLDLGKPFFAMRSYCGGEPILRLQAGDFVVIDGIAHEVLDYIDAPMSGSTESIREFTDTTGDMYLFTGDLSRGTARIVALSGLGG